MKRTLLVIGITTVALTVAAVAEDQVVNGTTARRAARASTTSGRTSTSASTNASANVRTRSFSARQNTSVRSLNHQATLNAQANAQTALNRSNARTARVATRQRGVRRSQVTNNTVGSNVATTGTNRFARGQNIQRQRALAGNTNRNVTFNRTRNVNRNVSVVNNWRSNQFSGRSYTAFRNYQRTWHDSGWWRSHYDRLIFVSGGWYFWNAGYWYPAWGYDPGYYYPYDGPIYGYGALTPDQVVENVQLQLQNDGYYSGPIDGILGSETRYALAAFQADHGLAVTSAVDRPTLSTLGLV